MKLRLGLLGYPLQHSFSKKYFNDKFSAELLPDCSYENYSIPNLNSWRELAQNEKLDGFNVTIPYKKDILNLLDKITPAATESGAVNTVLIKNNIWTGENTDIIGFKYSLLSFITSPNNIRQALILGTGGASSSAVYVLNDLKIPYKLVSRSPIKGDLIYENLKGNISNYDLIINTTPVGMYPNNDQFPNIPYNEISAKHYLYDMVYNPDKSLFLLYGEKRGASIKNGLEMLYLQAEAAWNFWTKHEL